jgi:hypothetical protein
MVPWPPLSRDDLKHAAGSAGFDALLPLLVRRLVAETGLGLTELDMPGGSGTAAGGFDGVVTAADETTFVPAGTSVWELSVATRAQTKADEDYGKRIAGPDGGATAGVSYVQVILAPWTKARTWAAQRSREGRWRQVRAYNLDRVHVWLDSAPATTAWLAGQLGKALPGVRAAEEWWTGTWLPPTRVPVTSDIVLAGREPAVSSLLALLAGGQQVITLGGDLRADEARAFAAAVLDQAGTVNAATLKARTLFVSEAHSLAQLLGQPQPLVLLLADAGLASDIPHQHPHQLVVVQPVGGRPDVTVPPVDGQVVEAHLRAAGVPSERAHALGTLARRSLSALRRAFAAKPAMLTPGWATAADVVRRRLLLLGGWDGTNDDDRRLVAECIGRPYPDVQEAALGLASTAETPFLGRVEDHWYLLSPEDAWLLLGPQLTSDDLAALRNVVAEVLGERDPLINLDTAARITAQRAGVRRQLSSDLRHGLARTLALLASTDSAVQAPAGMTGSRWVRLPVRDLFDAANGDGSYTLWTSLADVLTLLAEAAPEEFLQAMRHGLEGLSQLHAKMFTDAEPDEFGQPRSSPHSYFLWALEVLAWSPDHFDEAVDVLARLAAIDPGGRWSNRPSRSLAEILSCWRPNTAADEPQRLRALTRLLRDEPDVARRLLVDLIPDGHGHQTVHPGPHFRDWKQETPVTRADIIRTVTAIVDLLIADLDHDPDRYLALLGKLGSLPPAQRAVFADRLTALATTITDDQLRARLFDAIRSTVAHHREYGDTAWALPEDELRTLDRAAEAVEPLSAVLRAGWLFASDWITLADQSRRDDLTAYEIAVAERRSEAVGLVMSEGGLDAVAEMAAGTRYPHLVGKAIAEHTAGVDADMLGWLAEGRPARAAVAFAYLVARLSAGGTQLRDALLSDTDDPSAQAAILRATYDPPAAWEKLTELPAEVGEYYWREFTYFGLGPSFAYVLDAARGLMGAGRHSAALHLLGLYERQTDSAEAAETAVTACEGLLAGGLSDPEWPRLDRYHFQRIFALLARHRDAVGRQRVVALEWQLFPTLGFDTDAPTLHAALAEEPAFFAELVGYLYRRDDEDDTALDDAERVVAEQRRFIAERALEVLRSWRRCPGIGADGTVDLPLLKAWITDGRERLRADGRLRPGDGEIGHVLAFAPPDPDGLFPPHAVRDLLEELRSDRIETGLRNGILNRRGVTSRGLFDGGSQEWQLATSYREQAVVAGAWPRTRRLLHQIADWYESDARTEDQEAERRRRGLRE